MIYEKKPYWLRGGIIGIITAVIYNLISLIRLNENLISWLYGFLIDIIGLFIIGAIIGALLGLYINRGKKKSIPNKNLRKTRSRMNGKKR